LLSLDFGREKTSYFMGKDVRDAVSDKTVAGVLLGKAVKVHGGSVYISSKMCVLLNNRFEGVSKCDIHVLPSSVMV
jgi:hypothetical protein